MNLHLFVVILVSLLCYANSHILIPPFLPDGYQTQYYEQKFRISQLDSAQFKISGLPKEMFWTDNGTIFGTPTNFGQSTLTIEYDSLTESGSYQTVLVIKNNSNSDNALKANSGQLEMIFPENLILEKNYEEEIEFKLNKAIQPVTWKFPTLPKGVTVKYNGKLSVKIDKQGIYILRIQATDAYNKEIQACVTLNVQSSKSAFTESYAVDTIYEPNENVNRLMQITKKETEVTRQLTEANKKLGVESKILKENEQVFKRVTNNLIQLQNRATTISGWIGDAVRNKKVREQKLKEAYDILKNAQDNVNLAMIEQLSNNNLLSDSQKQKAKAQASYSKAAKELQNHAQVLDSIDKKLAKKQQDKLTSQNSLVQRKARYSDLAQLIISKEKQLASLNQQVARVYQEALRLGQNSKSQQLILSQQEAKYSTISNNLSSIDAKIAIIQSQIQDLTREKGKISEQISRLNIILKNMETNDIFNLQQEIQNYDLSVQNILFQAIKDWNSIGYQSAFIKDYISQIKFKGCNLTQYPAVEGHFTIKESSQVDYSYQTDSGYRILYGNCTKTSPFKNGDAVIVSGHTAQGVIHADKIVRQ